MRNVVWIDYGEDLSGEKVFSPAWARRSGKPERIGPQAEFSFSNSLTFLSAAGRISFKFIYSYRSAASF